MKLKKALGFLSEKYKEPSTCESCDGEFICGATVMGCWCVGVELTDEHRKHLRERFKKCLCRGCLENVATEF